MKPTSQRVVQRLRGRMYTKWEGRKNHHITLGVSLPLSPRAAPVSLPLRVNKQKQGQKQPVI